MSDAAAPFFPALKRTMTINHVVNIVFNTDLRSGHNGLNKLTVKLKMKRPHELEVGEFLIFVNRRRSAIKIYAANNTVAHFKMPDDRPMHPKVLTLVPRFFNGKELRYDDALKEVIKKEFKIERF